MNLAIFKPLTKVFARGALTAKHFRPEILAGVGIITGIGCVVFACKATLKVEAIVDHAKEQIDDIKDTQVKMADKPDVYDEQDARKDLSIVYTRTAVDLFKLYVLPAGLGALSLACFLGGQHILRKENAAITAAYMGLSEAFKQYRKRVVDAQGRDADMAYRYGIKKEEVVVEAEDGTQSVQTVTTTDPIGRGPSQYARFFDESNPNWSMNPDLSLLFLRKQQNYANDVLHANGHIFLNEVYDMLGLPRSEEGQYVGWVSGMGDDCVDFGLYNIDDDTARDFINGTTNRVLLDFNVDGMISHIFTKIFGEDFAAKVQRDSGVRNILRYGHTRR